MIEYRQTETAKTAIENIAFAFGMLEGGNMLTSNQRKCLIESLQMLRHLVRGAEKMQLNRECGGDGWWEGWQAIEETLADRPEIQSVAENETPMRLWVNVQKIFASQVYSVASGFSDKSMAESHRMEGQVTVEVREV